MPASSSTAATSSRAVGVPVVVAEHRHAPARRASAAASARIAACSGSPWVVRSPASSTRSTRPASAGEGGLAARSRSPLAAVVDVAGGGDADPALLLLARRATRGVDRHAPGGYPTSAMDADDAELRRHRACAQARRRRAARGGRPVPARREPGELGARRPGDPPRPGPDDQARGRRPRARRRSMEAGMQARATRPRSGCVKAWDGDVLVDLIFGPKGLPMTDEVIARGDDDRRARHGHARDGARGRADHQADGALRARAALREPAPDRPRAARAGRRGTPCATAPRSSPFARAFFVLAEGLEILPAERVREAAPHAAVRVVTPQGSGPSGPG